MIKVIIEEKAQQVPPGAFKIPSAVQRDPTALTSVTLSCLVMSFPPGEAWLVIPVRNSHGSAGRDLGKSILLTLTQESATCHS